MLNGDIKIINWLRLSMSNDDIHQRVTEEHDKQNKTKFIKEVSDSTPFML